MGVQGISPFSQQAPQGPGVSSMQSAGCCPQGGTPMVDGNNTIFNGGGNPSSTTPMPGANPMAGISSDTQMLMLTLNVMMVGVMAMIATALASIVASLSGQGSGTSALSGNPGATATSTSAPGSGTSNTSGGNGTGNTTGTSQVINNPQQTANGNYTLPLPDAQMLHGRSPFGAPRDGGARSHKGNDFIVDRGTPVLAIAEGEIIRAVPVDEGTAGIRIGIRHPNGDESFYYHLDEIGINPATGQPFKEGDTIASGQQLGTVGDTGNAKGLPHLHFEVHPGGGEAVDPWEYFIQDVLDQMGVSF